MKILIVSATHKEIERVYVSLDTRKCLEKNFFRGFAGGRLVDILITGVGASATASSLALKLLNSQYDLVLNMGICGSFRKDLDIGKVVMIGSEIWGDLGAEDHDEFLDLFDLKLLNLGDSPFTGNKLLNPGNIYSGYCSHLPQVNGITVNKSHGNKESIGKCIKKYSPDIESMEGAAVFNICISRGINFLCLRSISNFVEPRNRSGWNIEIALQNLTLEVICIISAITK
jgi:futalosine hydrolase